MKRKLKKLQVRPSLKLERKMTVSGQMNQMQSTLTMQSKNNKGTFEQSTFSKSKTMLKLEPRLTAVS